LKKSPCCPVCNSPLDEGHAKKHIDEMVAEKQEVEKVKLPGLLKQFEDYRKELEKFRKDKEFIQTIKDKVRIEENTKSTLETELTDTEDSLSQETDKQCPADLTEYQEKLNALEETVQALETELTELEKKINLDNELINILGDDGIKTYFFKKLVAILNKNVNRYLEKFELKNTTMTFDDQMQETMMTNMVNRTYSSYSSGERTRIDMSILLSFFDISRLISNWSCNILFIDELLDQNIDQSGIEQFVSTLHNLICENKKKLGIYIISHKLNELKVQISSTILIKKIHDYSILEEITNG